MDQRFETRTLRKRNRQILSSKRGQEELTQGGGRYRNSVFLNEVRYILENKLQLGL